VQPTACPGTRLARDNTVALGPFHSGHGVRHRWFVTGSSAGILQPRRTSRSSGSAGRAFSQGGRPSAKTCLRLTGNFCLPIMIPSEEVAMP